MVATTNRYSMPGGLVQAHEPTYTSLHIVTDLDTHSTSSLLQWALTPMIEAVMLMWDVPSAPAR